MRIRHLLAAAAIAVPMLITVAAVAPAQAAQRPLLPLTVTNNSGRADKVFLYVVGVNLTTGRLGWVNAGGAFTPWPRGNVPPVPAPDVAIAGPAPGASKTLQIPNMLSGRVYVAFGTKLKFFLTFDGLVQPAPWAPQDANHDILFDWSEFTYDGAGLFLNTSMVDMFSVPHAVAVTGSTGQTRRTGTLVAGGRPRTTSSSGRSRGRCARPCTAPPSTRSAPSPAPMRAGSTRSRSPTITPARCTPTRSTARPTGSPSTTSGTSNRWCTTAPRGRRRSRCCHSEAVPRRARLRGGPGALRRAPGPLRPGPTGRPGAGADSVAWMATLRPAR